MFKNLTATICPCCGCKNITALDPGTDCQTCPAEGESPVSIVAKTCTACAGCDATAKAAQATLTPAQWAVIVQEILTIALALFSSGVLAPKP